MYESVKARLEAEEAAAQEEQRLVDLLRAEEVAAAARQQAADRAARQEQMRKQMLADNHAQLQYKVPLPLIASIDCTWRMQFWEYAFKGCRKRRRVQASWQVSLLLTVEPKGAWIFCRHEWSASAANNPQGRLSLRLGWTDGWHCNIALQHESTLQLLLLHLLDVMPVLVCAERAIPSPPSTALHTMLPDALAGSIQLGRGGLQAEQRERQRQEEEAFKAAALQRMAEEDRLEQLSAQRRREKTAAHRREVERLLEHRRALFEAARVRLLLPACDRLLPPACTCWSACSSSLVVLAV